MSSAGFSFVDVCSSDSDPSVSVYEGIRMCVSDLKENPSCRKRCCELYAGSPQDFETLYDAHTSKILADTMATLQCPTIQQKLTCEYTNRNPVKPGQMFVE